MIVRVDGFPCPASPSHIVFVSATMMPGRGKSSHMAGGRCPHHDLVPQPQVW